MNLPKSILTKKQKKELTYPTPEGGSLIVTLRYDDECGNGHNSFAITGELKEKPKEPAVWGCIHNEIKEYAPELAHLIKWHLCSSDGPMHYLANSMYHARTCDTRGKLPGESTEHDTFVRFGDSPFLHSAPSKNFLEYIKDKDKDFWRTAKVIEVQHDNVLNKDGYQYGPQYTLTGFNEGEGWYKAPFDDLQKAESWLNSLTECKTTFKIIATEWASAIDPNLDAARSCAVWPEAELSDFTEEKLEARLPVLILEFKEVMESIGFVY